MIAAYHTSMPWDPASSRGWSVIRPCAIGHTPLGPVNLFREEVPEAQVFAKMECRSPRPW